MGFRAAFVGSLAAGFAVMAIVLGLDFGTASAFPGGTPDFQTDVGPYCASCHSSTSEEDLAGLGERSVSELAPNKHFAEIRAGSGRYAELSVEDRTRLVELLMAVDLNSTITLEFPPQVAPGETFQVTVRVTGGAGPSVGVGLVDRPHRFYARPASAIGWEVVGAPTIIGLNGPQTSWISRRPEREGRNITFVNVEDIQSSADEDRWSRAKIIFTMRAPKQIVDLPLVGAFFYGTETGASLSTRNHPEYGRLPLGGMLGNSGRVKFSATAVISVKEADAQPAAQIAPTP